MFDVRYGLPIEVYAFLGAEAQALVDFLGCLVHGLVQGLTFNDEVFFTEPESVDAHGRGMSCAELVTKGVGDTCHIIELLEELIRGRFCD